MRQALRQAVLDTFSSGNGSELSINYARARAEKALGLEEDHFKSHPIWKDKSKQIISATAVRDAALPA